MNVVRNEIRTGLLATITLAILAAALLYLGAPALLVGTNTFKVYFEDAGGIQPGAVVNLAGRRVGQVRRIYSPVPRAERPKPELQVVIEVEVSQSALIYREQKVMMVQYSLLADQMIDFTDGNEDSGLATEETRFIGERQLGLADAAPKLLEKLDPLMNRATSLIEELQKSAERLADYTAKGSDLSLALSNFRKLGDNLVDISDKEGDLRKSLNNIQSLTAEDSSLARTLDNARIFTEGLAQNKDIAASISNFRLASEKIKSTVDCLQGTVSGVAPELDATVRNAADFTDTIKRQPWRLIWPSTKKYPEDEAQQVYMLKAMEEVSAVAEQVDCPPGKKQVGRSGKRVKRPPAVANKKEQAKPRGANKAGKKSPRRLLRTR